MRYVNSRAREWICVWALKIVCSDVQVIMCQSKKRSYLKQQRSTIRFAVWLCKAAVCSEGTSYVWQLRHINVMSSAFIVHGMHASLQHAPYGQVLWKIMSSVPIGHGSSFQDNTGPGFLNVFLSMILASREARTMLRGPTHTL